MNNKRRFRLECFVRSMTAVRELHFCRIPIKTHGDNTIYFMEYFCSIKPEFRKIVNNRSCGNLITPLCYMECFAEYLGFSSFHEMEYFFYIKRDLCSDLYTTVSFIDAMCTGGDVIMVKNFMFDTMELSRSMIIRNWTMTLY